MFTDLLYDTDCKIQAQYLENIWRQHILSLQMISLWMIFRNVFPSDVISIIHKFSYAQHKFINDLRRTHHFLRLPDHKNSKVYGYYIQSYTLV